MPIVVAVDHGSVRAGDVLAGGRWPTDRTDLDAAAADVNSEAGEVEGAVGGADVGACPGCFQGRAGTDGDVGYATDRVGAETRRSWGPAPP